MTRGLARLQPNGQPQLAVASRPRRAISSRSTRLAAPGAEEAFAKILARRGDLTSYNPDTAVPKRNEGILWESIVAPQLQDGVNVADRLEKGSIVTQLCYNTSVRFYTLSTTRGTLITLRGLCMAVG